MAGARPWIYVLAVALLTLALLILVAGAAGALTPERVLEEVRQAYAEIGPFHETLELELYMPGRGTGTRRQDYGVDSRGGAFFRLAADGRDGLRIVARDSRIVADWAHIPQRYAESVYSGDFAAAFVALEAPQVQLWAPPSIVAAQGGSAAAFLEALRFGVLMPAQPTWARESEGGSILEVELAADNGSLVLGIDKETGRFATIRFLLGEGETQVRATGTFSFSAGEPVGELEWPDTEGRASVATLTALEAADYPIGQDAPAITIEALDGEPVELGALVGQVIVLDFWATWCVPCWSALEHTEELTAWAKGTDLPVRIFAVDSLEHTAGLEAQREQAKSFLAAKQLELEVLVDHDDSAFAAFHNPGLPSLVIVDREGRLAEYHSGVLDDMSEAVKARVLELLESSE